MSAPLPDDLLDTLRLSMISGVGPRVRMALMDRFGSARAVLNAAPNELRDVPGVGPKLMRKIAEADHEIDVKAEIDLCRQRGIDIIVEADHRYPAIAEGNSRPAGRAVRARRAETGRCAGSRHRRHAAWNAVRTADCRAVGPARLPGQG